MTITLRYFAAIRDITRRPQEAISLPLGATIADAQSWLADHYAGLAPILARCQVAQNRTFVTTEARLTDGDEVVFLPPMAGGH